MARLPRFWDLAPDLFPILKRPTPVVAMISEMREETAIVDTVVQPILRPGLERPMAKSRRGASHPIEAPQKA